MNKDEYLEAIFQAETSTEVLELELEANKELDEQDLDVVIEASGRRKVAIRQRTLKGSLDETIDEKGTEISEDLRQKHDERKALHEEASESLAIIPQGMELTEDQVDATVRHFALFERVKKEVLDFRMDVLYIGARGAPVAYAERDKASSVYIRKSGWRKLAMVFGINLKVVDMERENQEDDDGTYYLWNARVRAEHPASGKYAEGIGVASSRDQFFTRGGKRTADEKDIKLKAQTVGENRAISNLIGGGQMTAEEV